jgi:hypothetical protein
MLVKSMLVPLVDATAVPEVMPRTAPEFVLCTVALSVPVLGTNEIAKVVETVGV